MACLLRPLRARRSPHPRFRTPEAGFLLPLSAAASLLLLLSGVSLQAAALQARSQVRAGQRLRQAEDQLMSAAQHYVAERFKAGSSGLAGQPAGAAPAELRYRLVAFEGPHWQPTLDAEGQQRGEATFSLELVPTQPASGSQRAAFALELARSVGPQGAGPQRLLALRELGLRGRASAEVEP